MKKTTICGSFALLLSAAAACSAPPQTNNYYYETPGGQAEAGAAPTGAPSSNDPPPAAPSSADSGSPQPQGTVVPVAAGYLQAKGGQLVDSSGNPARLTGIAWFGLETSNYAPHGLWARPMGAMLDQIKSIGFNVIRVPFSNQLFDAASVPNGIDYTQNPDLMGLNGFQIMDKLVAGAKQRGLKILLDRHRPDSSGQSALWYTATVSEDKWISDWKMLASHYANEPTVIGADLHDEPHDTATWGDGSMTTDWRAAAERAGNAILTVNPNWLIIVEGVQNDMGSSYWWGGNLRGAATAPVNLSIANRVVYSPHDYPSSVGTQTWFSAPNYPNNLTQLWHDSWGYLATNGDAPVLIGEFGTKNQTSSDQQWLAALVGYIVQQKLSFTYWSWNPDSGDTGGIVQDDWLTVNQPLVDAIKPALAPMLP